MRHLARLSEQTRSEMDHLKTIWPQSFIEKSHYRPLSLLNRFQKSTVNVIAEIKFASPSQAVIHPVNDPWIVADEYIQAGARALSVLTQRSSFCGRPEFIRRVRQMNAQVSILMKDFFIDPYQVYLARFLGADAVLLIVALHPFEKLKQLYDLACSLGLDVLVEVHNLKELEQALRLPEAIIGVNNRNLKTLTIDLNTGRQLADAIPKEVPSIIESGIESVSHVEEFLKLGYSGFLVGSSLMRQEHPGRALKKLFKGIKT